MAHTLTIFTPAYNRAHTIKRTYESLCRQTCKDFEWLIVDDGSTDDTEILIQSFINENKIDIRYIYQQNQGMHGAHNTAYKNIVTELNICIDSDDYMPDDAVEKIIEFWRKKGSDKYAGIIGLDIDCNTKKNIGSKFNDNLTETTLTDFYANGGSGDKKLVYRTDIIKQYPEYPIFEGEKYVGLAYKYMLIDKDYTLLTINEPLVEVDYQLDGSSMNMYKQYWNNPNGFAFYRKTEMVCTQSMKRKFMVCIHYVSSCIIAKKRNYIKESPYKLLTIIATPFGLMLYLHIKRKIKAGANFKFK